MLKVSNVRYKTLSPQLTQPLTKTYASLVFLLQLTSFQSSDFSEKLKPPIDIIKH